jgi:hypothetical protein
MNTVELVGDIVKPIAEEKGFRVVDIEYVKEGKIGFCVSILISQVASI